MGQEGRLGVTSYAFGSAKECEGMNPHTPKWTPILGFRIPMNSWIFKGRLQGQNPLDWIFFYIIRKLLKCKCLKWVRTTNLDIWNISYGQKKGRKSNWQFDSWPLNVGNRPNFLTCRWCATYHWKTLDKGYNFALNVIASEVCTQTYGPPKLRKSQLWEFQDFHLGVPGQNAIWMWASWRDTKFTIRGKVVASPKSGAWWVLWVRICPWLVQEPKVLKLCTNQLNVWFV